MFGHGSSGGLTLSLSCCGSGPSLYLETNVPRVCLNLKDLVCFFFLLVVQGGSNSIYDVKIKIDSSSERAECSFFMKNGTCKYGDNCKYSHPKERMLPNLFNPVVLPARPVSSFVSLCFTTNKIFLFISSTSMETMPLLCSGTTSMW